MGKSSFFTNNVYMDKRSKLLLFLLWPLGAFIYSLRCLQSKSSQIVFYLMCVAFGLCIECKNDTFDMSRISEDFFSWKNASFSELSYVASNFAEGMEMDLYKSALCWFVNQFSHNEHVFWMVASMIFGYFYVRSLSFVLKDSKFESSWMGFLIVLMFVTPETIFSVTGLRFWTAGWVAIYCTLQLLIREKYWYIFGLLLTPFIHMVYWIYVILVLLLYAALLFKKTSERLLIIGLLLSYPLSYLSLSFISTAIDSNLLPRSLELAAISYTGLEHMEEFNREGTGLFWLSELFDMILNTYYFILVLVIIKHRKQISNPSDKRLFLFLLVIYSFSNLTLIVPHLGIRYVQFVKILLPLLWLRIFGLNRFRPLIYLYPVCASFYLVKLFFMRYADVLESNFLYDSFVAMVVKNLF